MTTLFLIDGASGTGKSDLVEYTRSHKHCGVLVKATTRELRDYEVKEGVALDLTFHSTQDFNSLNLDYQYEYHEEYYGFSKRQLNECLTRSSNVFAIIRNIPLMRKLKKDYAAHQVISVYIHSEPRLIEQRMRVQGRTEEEIEFRLSSISNTFEDYLAHRDFFEEYIVNSSDKATYYSSIDSLLAKYSRVEDL